MAESSSPTGRTLRPRNTSAVFGYWNALTLTRRWHGRAKASPPLGGRSKCERSFSIQHPTKISDALCRLLRRSTAIWINPWARNDAVYLRDSDLLDLWLIRASFYGALSS